MAYIIPHNEPALSLTLDLHESTLVLEALMQYRRNRFGEPFPEGAEVTFEELAERIGSEEEAEDYLALMELEVGIGQSLESFEEEE